MSDERPVEARYDAASLMAVRQFVDRIRPTAFKAFDVPPKDVGHLVQSFDAACWLLRDALGWVEDHADDVRCQNYSEARALAERMRALIGEEP